MKIPKKSNFEAAKELKENMLSWNYLYELLLREFNKFKENNNLFIIGYKIDLVDKLYNCNLKMDKRRVAIEIINLSLDEKFEKEDPVSIVKEIAEVKFPDYRRSVGYVFSSKFCHFHKPSKFPIYDQYAGRALSELNNKKYSYYENNYRLFKTDLDFLISQLSWKSSYNEIDEYLWLYGKWLLWKNTEESKKDSKFSKEFCIFVKTYKDLFYKLEP